MSLAIRAAVVFLSASAAAAQPVTLLSVSTSGAPGNGSSIGPVISADGRYVAFASQATNLVPGDTNGKWDVFVRDLNTGVTSRVSVSSSGAQADGDSGAENSPGEPLLQGRAISADGRFIAFFSRATNLVGGVTPPLVTNVYVHDRDTGSTSCVSVRADNGLPAGATISGTQVAISADGRYVGFTSNSSFLVGGDIDSNSDAFVHDRLLGVTHMVSVSSGGGQIGFSSFQAMSGDGRLAAFITGDSLEPDDTNGVGDVYVHNLDTLISTRASASSLGVAFGSTAMSADGRFVSYGALDPNLVPGYGIGRLPLCVHDLTSSGTFAINRSTSGDAADTESSWRPRNAFSADARFVAFVSGAGNLASGQSGNRAPYVRDTLIGTTRLIGSPYAGHVIQDGTSNISISGDGRAVVFDSWRSYPGTGDSAAPDVFIAGNPCTEPVCVDVTFADEGSGSFLWNDADIWSSEYSDPVPNSLAETAVFNRAGTYEVTIDESVEPAGVTVRSGTPILRALDTTTMDVGQPDCVCNPFAIDISGPVAGPEPATLRLVQSESHESSGFTCVGNIGIGDGESWAGKLHLFGGTLEMAGDLVVGNGVGAQGFLTLTARGTLVHFEGNEPSSLVVGRSGGRGEVSVTSAPLPASSSALVSAGPGAALGDGGRGLLNIMDGGLVKTTSLVIGKSQDPTLSSFEFEGEATIEGVGSVLSIEGYSGLPAGASNACVVGSGGDGRMLLVGHGELRFVPSDAGRLPSLILGGASTTSSPTSGVLDILGGMVTGSPPLQMGVGTASETALSIQSVHPTVFRSARVGIGALGNSVINLVDSGTVFEVGDAAEGDGLAPCQLGVGGSGIILAEDCSIVRLRDTELGFFSGSFGRLSATSRAAIFTHRCVVGGREPGALGQIEATNGGLVSCTELSLGAGATITGDRLTVTSIGSLEPPEAPCSSARGISTEGRIETADLSVFTDPFGGGAPAINVPITEILPGASFGGTGPFEFNMENSARVRPGGQDAVGQMIVNGSYTQTVDGTLEIDMNPFDLGAIFGPSDLLTASGTAVLGGTLRVIVAAGAEPLVLGQSLQVLSAPTVLGTFHHVEAVGPDAGYECQAIHNEAGVSVVVTLAPPTDCPGDANGDGLVTFSDISRVLANWGAVYTPGTGPGDANHDGVVNFADVTSVLTNFGVPCP